MPRHPDPDLESRILAAASRLWSRGGEKALTMRAVAKAAGTTTPTVYERYRDRGDILRALRFQTRAQLFAALSNTRTLHEAILRHLDFALENSHSYEVLFDGVGKPPAMDEAWPSFNLIRDRVGRQIGRDRRCLNRVMMAVWSQMHGTAMLMIRGQFDEGLRTQTIYACIDAIDAMTAAARHKTLHNTGPKWPSGLVLGEGKRARSGNGNGAAEKPHKRDKKKKKQQTG